MTFVLFQEKLKDHKVETRMVVDEELLLAYCYFDKNKVGYLKVKMSFSSLVSEYFPITDFGALWFFLRIFYAVFPPTAFVTLWAFFFSWSQ
jgi:hypothetical protein